MIASGILVMAVFIWQQAKTKSEPLVPLGLFRDRNFCRRQLRHPRQRWGSP